MSSTLHGSLAACQARLAPLRTLSQCPQPALLQCLSHSHSLTLSLHARNASIPEAALKGAYASAGAGGANDSMKARRL